MARRIRTLFIDDLDAGPAEGTVRFALDGTDDEIDLRARHGDELRAAPGTYVEHAREVGGTARRPGARGGRKPAAGTVAVRSWARDIGYDIKNRGRTLQTVRGGRMDGYADVVDRANRRRELLQREPAGQKPFLPQDPGNLDPGEVDRLRCYRSVDEFLLQLPGTLEALLVDEPAQERACVDHVGVSHGHRHAAAPVPRRRRSRRACAPAPAPG